VRDLAALRRGEIGARRDERHVREGLREVAERLAVRRIEAFRVEVDVVRETEQPPEQGLGLVELTGVRETVHQPERAEEERALPAREPIAGAA
jgi:hypothetical protein